MQIHELNNFTGTLGSGAYLAVDDGNDTGKLSTQQLLAATEARIDNIIAGPAPSAEEIVDARRGDDGVTYPSLGDAIRDQVGDLKSDYERLDRNKVNQPLDGNNQPINGTSGQILRTKGDGTTEWASVGLPTDAQTAQAVSNWLDDHPEATTTVQDGSIGKKKLTESLNKEFESKMSRNDIWQLSMQEEKILDFSSFNANIPTNYSPQGVCYNLDTEQFVFTFSNNSDWSQDSLIIVTDSSFNKVSEHYAQLWHANDITYNPSTNRYVVAPSHDDCEIIVLDNLFNVVQAVSVEGIPAERILQIAYDATDGGYFLTTGDTRKTYKVNSEFMQPRLFADQTMDKFTENTYTNVYTFDVQGCDAYNGELISLAWFWRSGSETNGITRIGVFHDGDEDCYYKMDYSHSLWNEPEAVCIVNDGGYVFSYYDSNLVIRRLFINSDVSDISADTTLQYLEISSMVAWQEYSKTIHLRAGKYIIDAYTNPINYANAQQAFRLVVNYGSGNFYSNTVVTYNGVPSQANLTKIIDVKKDTDVVVTLMSDKAYTAKTLYVNIRILYLQNA